MSLNAGDFIGQYQIIRQIGAGGMATVFLAQHPKLKRQVAIKVIHESLQSDEGFRARFERESNIVAGLEHPHIIPVYDYTEVDGRPALIMKYVEGNSLKALLDESPMTSPQEILRVMEPIASALDYAHAQGVLHRDVKPSNIVLDEDDTPYLADFGLARIAMSGESTLSQDSILGTPQYISPEQALGLKSIDHHTDIYSFGVILYQLFVGSVPFSADTPYATIHHHIHTPLPIPSQHNADVGPSVEAVLMQVLEKDPKDRYNTAMETVIALRNAIKLDGMSSLNPDLAKQAQQSIALQRDTFTPTTPMQQESSKPATTEQILDSKFVKTQYHYRHGWVWRVSAIIVFIVAIGMFSQQIDDIYRTTENLWQTNMVSIYDEQTETLTSELPELSQLEARRIIVAKPELPLAYVAAAQTFWQLEHVADADDALALGINRLDSTDISVGEYLLLASNVAHQAGQPQVALTYYIQAINMSNNTQDSRYVRDIAGREIFYIVYEEKSVTYEDILASEYHDTAYGHFLLGLSSMSDGNFERAELHINELENYQLPIDVEYKLLRAEYELAQGNENRASTHLDEILDYSSIPSWVQARVDMYETQLNQSEQSED